MTGAPIPAVEVPQAESATRARTATRSGPSLGRGVLHLSLIAVMVIWAIPAIALLVASFRPAAVIEHERLVEGHHAAVGLHARELRVRPGSQSPRPGLPQQLHHHRPGHGPGGDDRRLRRLRLRLDGLPGRNVLFVIVVGLLVVPLQITLIPVLNLLPRLPSRSGFEINGTMLAVWLAHTGYGLPFAALPATQLLRLVATRGLRVGGDRRSRPLDVVLPACPADERAGPGLAHHLPVPVGLERPPGRPGLPRRCVRRTIRCRSLLANLTTSFGGGWQFLTAAAFVSMIVPIIVFLSLQRYFVRGITGGAVKG